MICNNCGCEIEEGSNFCPYCGAGVYYDTPNVQQPVYTDNTQYDQQPVYMDNTQNYQTEAAAWNTQSYQNEAATCNAQPNYNYTTNAYAPKRKKSALKNAFLMISIFNFVNLFLHVFSFFKPFIFAELDYGFYALKIIVYFAFYRFIKKNVYKDFVATAKFVKATIILDVIEVAISFVNSYAIIMPWLLLLTILLKLAVNILMYADLVYIAKEDRKYRDYYKIMISALEKKPAVLLYNNIFCVIFIVLRVLTGNSFFLLLTALFMILRFVCELNIISDTVGNLEKFYGPNPVVSDFSFFGRMHQPNTEKKKILPVIKICLACAFCAILITGTFLYFSFDEDKYNDYLSYKEMFASGKKYDKDATADDYIFVYRIPNRLPEWTGLRREKSGFINKKTGMDTGPRYKGLMIDEVGFAWNGKDFLDVDGNVLIKGPFAARVTLSKRQNFIRDLLSGKGVDDDVRIIRSFEDWEVTPHQQYVEFREYRDNKRIFINGITRFYCDLNESYGLLRNDGTVIVKPIYDYLHMSSNHRLMLAANRARDKVYAMNADGKILASYEGWSASDHIMITQGGVVEYEDEIIEADETNDWLYYLIDEYGNTFDGLYSDSSDGISFRKYTGEIYESDHRLRVPGGYTMVLIWKGKIVFESDKYERIEIETRFFTGEITEIAGITKDGKREVLDIKLK